MGTYVVNVFFFYILLLYITHSIRGDSTMVMHIDAEKYMRLSDMCELWKPDLEKAKKTKNQKICLIKILPSVILETIKLW